MGKLTFLYPRFNDFFSHTVSRSGLHSYHTFSPRGEKLSRRKFLAFQTLYSNGFGFNFFINLRWDKCSLYMLCKLLLLFATTVWFSHHSFFFVLTCFVSCGP